MIEFNNNENPLTVTYKYGVNTVEPEIIEYNNAVVWEKIKNVTYSTSAIDNDYKGIKITNNAAFKIQIGNTNQVSTGSTIRIVNHQPEYGVSFETEDGVRTHTSTALWLYEGEVFVVLSTRNIETIKIERISGTSDISVTWTTIDPTQGSGCRIQSASEAYVPTYIKSSLAQLDINQSGEYKLYYIDPVSMLESPVLVTDRWVRQPDTTLVCRAVTNVAVCVNNGYKIQYLQE